MHAHMHSPFHACMQRLLRILFPISFSVSCPLSFSVSWSKFQICMQYQKMSACMHTCMHMFMHACRYCHSSIFCVHFYFLLQFSNSCLCPWYLRLLFSISFSVSCPLSFSVSCSKFQICMHVPDIYIKNFHYAWTHVWFHSWFIHTCESLHNLHS